ncbi:hypothetical protein Scep_019331 [Stephania cephalantha]|uniref:Uncharacterized protein n=1 Tax=Stephania cephalantha TaxID=152367 RepID=A0AAP0IB48_9MAGN
MRVILFPQVRTSSAFSLTNSATCQISIRLSHQINSTCRSHTTPRRHQQLFPPFMPRHVSISNSSTNQCLTCVQDRNQTNSSYLISLGSVLVQSSRFSHEFLHRLLLTCVALSLVHHINTNCSHQSEVATSAGSNSLPNQLLTHVPDSVENAQQPPDAPWRTCDETNTLN